VTAIADGRVRTSKPVAALAAAAAVTGVALPIGHALPLLGAPIVALILGMALPAGPLRPALGRTSRIALQTGIVLLGATISLRDALGVGAASLPVMLASLGTALLGAALLGRFLGVPERLRVLVGVGTAICGASAIAAVSGAVRPREAELRYAISTIFLFNLVAVLTFPALGHLLGLGQAAFGLWAGTAVNDTSSVVAAGLAYGHAAATHAVIVKLTRTLMIVPISLALAFIVMRRETATGGASALRAARRAMPWFIVWFLLASAARTAALVGPGAAPAITQAGLILTTLAMAAVGLSSDLREMRATGVRPLLLGALVWVTVAGVSLATQAASGRL
jgi:uncharacterized integral membrane protein (TIGR00698 family)